MVLFGHAADPLFLALLCLQLGASLVLFVLYGIDKARSKRGAQRIAEKSLHLWALFGGWPGGFIGQRLFRHKTKKVSFLVIYWITVVVNCLLWGLLCYYRYV